MQEQLAPSVRSLKNRKVWRISSSGSYSRIFLYLSFIRTSCSKLRRRYYYYYYYYNILIFWGRSFEKSAVLECLQIMTTLFVFP